MEALVAVLGRMFIVLTVVLSGPSNPVSASTTTTYICRKEWFLMGLVLAGRPMGIPAQSPNQCSNAGLPGRASITCCLPEYTRSPSVKLKIKLWFLATRRPMCVSTPDRDKTGPVLTVWFFFKAPASICKQGDASAFLKRNLVETKLRFDLADNEKPCMAISRSVDAGISRL